MAKELLVQQLVERAARGDREAFDQLVATFRDPLLKSIRARAEAQESRADPEKKPVDANLRMFYGEAEAPPGTKED